MKQRQMHLNPALPIELDVMRLHGYIRRHVNPTYERQSKYQKQHVHRTPREHALTLRRQGKPARP